MCDLSKDLSPGDAANRRVRAINWLVALSYRKEVERPRSLEKACPVTSLEQALREDSLSKDPFPLIFKNTQCIIYIGDVRGTVEYWTRPFSTPHKMMNHVDNHLKVYPVHKPFSCRHPKCVREKLILKDIEQFKLHVFQIHKIMLRS
jgi:hypothetical protein